MMTDEEKKFIVSCIESGVGANANIEAEFLKRFRAESLTEYKRAEINSYKCDYLLKRLGSSYFNLKKLRVFQCFEAGLDIGETSARCGVGYSAVNRYYSEWRRLDRPKKPPKAPALVGIHTGSGAMFGRNTRRNTIWISDSGRETTQRG